PRATLTAPLVTPPVLETVKIVPELVVPTPTVPKSDGVGVIGEIASAAGVAPVPESAAIAAPPGDALAVSVAVFAPVEVGPNTTAMVHEPPAASVTPLQVSELLVNDAQSVPPRSALTAPLAAPPVLETVKVLPELVVPFAT